MPPDFPIICAGPPDYNYAVLPRMFINDAVWFSLCVCMCVCVCVGGGGGGGGVQ